MRALDKKLIRDLKRLWAQGLAIALVLACGVATLVLAIGSYRSLEGTRDAYYERHKFASVFATSTRAPQTLTAQIRKFPGVLSVEARITESVLLDIPGLSEPASGLLLSIPDHALPRLNQPYLRSGRMPHPDRKNEALISNAFAKANGFTTGSRFSGIANGKKITFSVSGIALSPEFIYALGPGELVPDDRRFGIIWMREKTLAGVSDLDDAFNSISLALLPGHEPAQVISELDRLLKPYGGTGAYTRKDQLSHAFLDSELDQLQAMARIIPPIFLLVSAFLINMILSRLIALEREQIGLLKALGYSSFSIASHYVKLVVAIATIGVLIGFAAGTWLGDGMARLYGKFFHFPFLIFEYHPDVYALAAGLSISAAVAGALKAVYSAVSLPPATAMQPAPPTRYASAGVASRVAGKLFSQLTIMACRHMIRWPLRTGFTVFGTSMAVALLITALFTFGSINFMIDTVFFRTERQDATITFANQLPPRAMHNVNGLPGVYSVEPFRTMAVDMQHGSLKERVSITGKLQSPRLSRIMDLDLAPVSLPAQGLILSERLADKLKVRSGDTVRMKLLEEGGLVVEVPVVQIIQAYIGLTAYMNLAYMDGLSRIGPRRSGAFVEMDGAQVQQLYRAIKETPMAASITIQSASLQQFRNTVEQNITTMTTVYVVLAVIIAFGVVYNSARILLSERARELASLRVLGFTQREVAQVLIVELGVAMLLAQPVGWALGSSFSWLVVQGFQNDLFRVPFVIERSAFGWSSLVVMLAAVISGLIVVSRVYRLDLIRVLKTRE
ncbi:MAG: FtsX-like permease family protein [Anderseniella sp.]